MKLEIKIEIIGTYWLCFAVGLITGPCAMGVGRYECRKRDWNKFGKKKIENKGKLS